MNQNTTQEKQSTYKKQTFLSSFQFSTEVINLIIVIVTAIKSKSLIIWLDLINSLGNTLRTGLMSVFSKKMMKNRKYEYNYGIGKAEAMIAFFCNCFVFVGLIATFGLSIFKLFRPEPAEDSLLWAIIFKFFCVFFDTPILIAQYKIKKRDNNKVANSGFMGALASLLFDAVAFISVLVVFITRDMPGCEYISPILSILIAIFLLIICIRQIIRSIVELTDKTLPEEEQLKILKVLSQNYDKFEAFDNVKTRYNGNLICVDVSISFSNETQFSEIKELRENLQKQLNEVIDDCVVTIVVEEG